MALTNAQCRSLLKANLHNDTTFTDPTDLDTFLTLGQQRIVRDSPHTLGIKETTISVVASTREYSLASDFYQMRGMFLPSQNWTIWPYRMSDFVEQVEYQNTVPSGPPRSYQIIGFSSSEARWRVKFDYDPDASYTVKYWYYWMPSDISGSGTPVHSSIGFADLLVWAATALARERHDPEGYQIALDNYNRLLPAYRAYDVGGPDRVPVLDPDMNRGPGSTLRLDPAHYPAN